MNPNLQQQMQVAPIPNPPRPTPIPAQPIPNPNNRPTQPVQNIEVQTFPTYVITPASFNGIQLRSGRVLNKPNPTVVIQEEEQVDNQAVEEEEQMDNQSDEERDTPVQQEIPPHIPHPSEIPQKTNPPPYPERLLVKKSEVPLGHNLETELRNICVNIPLLQAIKDIPIYANIVRDICIKNPGRKRKEPPVIQVVGQLSEFISEMPSKYNDPGNPVVTIEINGVSFPNTLIDLGATINVMSVDTMKMLQLNHLRPTQTLLELADKSVISPAGSLDDVTITLASWEYPVDFLVIHPKSSKPGHPVVLGRPWLATADAFISCQSGEMTISNGIQSQKLILFPPAQPTTEVPFWLENPYGEEDCTQPLLTLKQVKGVQEKTEEHILSLFLADTKCIEYPQSFPEYTHIFSSEFQEIWHPSTSTVSTISQIDEGKESVVQTVEISPGKSLYINASLETNQQQKLIQMIQGQSGAFAWDYSDMKGIHPDTCMHHIYTNDQIRPVRKPQRRMNPALKDIVKEELQKLLHANFIYPISDSKWVSPLVIVPKKNGKWRICVEFQELNKATYRDYFPFPFIDQVLDTLSGKRYFSFLDGFSGYNQIQISPEDQDKTTFTFPWGTYAYRVLPFGLCNAPSTFQRVVLAIFSDLTHDCVEVYMDDFTVYGDDFQ
jgi:hypothetical protein